MVWRSLTPAEAAAHPRHGLKGWLGALLALHLLMLLVVALATLSVMLDPESVVLEEMPGPRWTELALTWSTLFAVAIFPLFALFRSRWTAWATAIGYGVSLAVGVLFQVLYPVEGDWIWIGVEVIVDAVILRFLFLGIGPNVTFRHRVPA